jgi:hypothetical protein
MNNLSETYDALGRHQEALVLKENALEYYRRVFPESHPHIGVVESLYLTDLHCLTVSVPGDTLANLAVTYGKLGRHQDALVLREKVLEWSRRALPANHPDIGEMA